MTRGGVARMLDEFATWRDANRPDITVATVAVRASTVRKALKLKKDEPLVFRGLAIRCIGSKRWRLEHPGEVA
jgi:hypothetical protein